MSFIDFIDTLSGCFMTHCFRETLYMPLGLFPSVFFACRMLIQWVQAEKQGVSHVSPLFWKLSFWGNLSLFLHHFVQVQFPFAIIQVLNAVIAWRNLDLMQAKQPRSFKFVLLVIACGIALATGLFLIQSYCFIGEIEWIRTPKKPWDISQRSDSYWLHLIGVTGGMIYASRFWVQWLIAECQKISTLDRLFWLLSIFGSAFLMVYSFQTKDIVIFYYNAFALVPYARNLILLRKRRES